MRRSISTSLGLAAATAVLAIGLPALATPASAATLTTAPSAGDYDEFWGSYYSKYYDDSRASAKGRIWTEDDDSVHVQGKVYDRYSPSRLCGYVQFKLENYDGDESYYWARKCGSQGYQSFHFFQEEIDNVQVRTCYWDKHHAKKTLCGKWRYIYEADGEE